MITLAIVFLAVAIIGGVFGFLAAGPVGPLVFVVFLALAAWSFFTHRRDRTRGGPRM